MPDKTLITANYSPLTLAYVGDAVIELWVRSFLISEGDAPVGAFNKRALQFVSAVAQSGAVQKILPFLSSEEEAVFKRGRNTHTKTVPKNAQVSEYRRATGLEALMGWLWLCGEKQRADELLRLAFCVPGKES